MTDKKNEPRPNQNDWHLQNLVDIVNNSEGSKMGITLLSHGFLISGDLIGGKQYFAEFGSQFGVISSDTDQKVQEHFQKIGEDVYSEENQKKEDGPTFLH